MNVSTNDPVNGSGSGFDSQSIHALSGAYVVDALDDEERVRFEAHLPHCPDCRAEVAGLREAAALLADDSALAPPPSLRDEVLAAIRTTRPLPPEVPSRHEGGDNVVPLRRRPGRLRLALAAAAAVVVGAVGVGLVTHPWTEQTTQLSAADRVLAAPDARRISMEFDDGSKATVVRSVKEGRAVLVTQDMAAPPRGKVYELWLQDPSGSMEPAGLMHGRGDHKVLLRGNANDSIGVGITVEPEGGSPEPTSKPVALFDLSKTSA